MKRFILALTVLLFAAQLEAAVSITGSVSSGRRTGSSTTALTVSHTATSDTDIIAVAVCGMSQPAMTATFDGNSMIQPVSDTDQVGNVHWFIYFSPGSVTGNIVVTPGTNSSLALVAWNLKSAAGTIAFDRKVDIFGATNFTFNTRGQTDGMLLDAGCSDSNNQVFTGGGSQTVDVSQDSLADTSAKMAAGHLTPSGSSETVGFTFSVSDIATASALSISIAGAIPAGAPTGMAAVSYATTPEAIGSLTWLHPNRAQDNLILVICNSANADTTVSTVTFNGDSLTENVESNLVSINSLTSPDVGTLKVVATFSGAGRIFSCTSYSFRSDGVRNTATRGSITESLNVTSVSGDTVVDHLAGELNIDANLSWTAGAGQTKIYSVSLTKTGVTGMQQAASWEAATSTTTTMSWTISPDNGWTTLQGAVSVKPSTVPFQTFTPQRLIKVE